MPSFKITMGYGSLCVAVCVCVSTLAAGVAGAGCNGHSTPGPRNTLPIDTAAPRLVREVKNGKLYAFGQGDDKKDLVHLWGTPYENGLAHGQLLGDKLVGFITEAYDYIEGQIVANVNNATWCAEHKLECSNLRGVLKMTLEVRDFICGRCCLGGSIQEDIYFKPTTCDLNKSIDIHCVLPCAIPPTQHRFRASQFHRCL